MMAEDSVARILRLAKEHDVKFVRLWFTDILGFLKSSEITLRELRDALESGKGFDGSSVEGLARLEESDLIAKPDLTTFALMPWSTDGGKVARLFCDLYETDGRPHMGDPRGALKRVLARAAAMGYRFNVGPELEYFYFRSAKGTPEVVDEGGYFDLTPKDVASDLRRETALLLEDMGIGVECVHHEVAPSQHEIDLRYDDALAIADHIMTLRLAVKEVALRHGLYATFMPKPLFGQNGSGMHLHMSLSKDGRNAFFDPNDRYHLSKVAYQFTAGILRHVCEFTAITNQWVNSYKRLVPGYEAPVYISWGQRNRSALVRVPRYKEGRESATRIEFRAPDPACNPYLALAVILAAGLRGIERGYEIPSPVDDNIYEMQPEVQEARGIGSLPGNLYAAILLAEKSDLVRDALGDHLFQKFIANKKIEWEQYRIHVTQFELDRYLSIL